MSAAATKPTFTVRVATPEDAAELRVLAIRVFTNTFLHHPAEERNAYFATAYAEETLRKEISSSHYHTLLLFDQQDLMHPCGYTMLVDGSRRPSSDDSDGNDDSIAPAEDSLELKRIYVDTPYHGTGAAHVLMEHIVAYIKQKNRKSVWLGVQRDNVRAQGFYRKYKFEQVGTRSFQIGDYLDSDFIFELQQE